MNECNYCDEYRWSGGEGVARARGPPMTAGVDFGIWPISLCEREACRWLAMPSHGRSCHLELDSLADWSMNEWHGAEEEGSLNRESVVCEPQPMGLHSWISGPFLSDRCDYCRRCLPTAAAANSSSTPLQIGV